MSTTTTDIVAVYLTGAGFGLLASAYDHDACVWFETNSREFCVWLSSLILHYAKERAVVPDIHDDFVSDEANRRLLEWLHFYPEVLTAFTEAARSGKWVQFCQNALFKTPLVLSSEVSQHSNVNPELYLEQAYQGNSHELLKGIIDESITDKQYLDHPYTNHIDIVQSLGMGKSRMVDELAKATFTIPFNFRPGDEQRPIATGASVNTPSDRVIRDLLLIVHPKDCLSQTSQTTRYLLFFAALFQRTLEELKWTSFKLDTLSSAWRKHLLHESTRSVFYHSVIKRYVELRSKPLGNGGMGPTLDLSYSAFDALSKEEQQHRKARNLARNALAEFHKFLKVVHSGSGGPHPVVVYFDDVDALKNRKTGDGATFHDALCVTFRNLGAPAFAIFIWKTPIFVRYNLETDQKLFFADRRKSSELVGSRIHPPFTIPLSDCYPGVANMDHPLTLAKLASVRTLVYLSRPLFRTHYTSLVSQDTETADTKILEFATLNFLNGSRRLQDIVNPHDRDIATLAILCLRFKPKLVTRSVDFESALVEHHLRVIYEVPQHRRFMESGYYSEPILAHVAAALMAEDRNNDDPVDPDAIARLLLELYNHGFIFKGSYSQAGVRLILLSTMDRTREHQALTRQHHDEVRVFDRTQRIDEWSNAREKMEKRQASELQDLVASGILPVEKPLAVNWSEDVPLTLYLRILVGEANYAAHIANSLPDNAPGETFDKVFANSVVRFTHFSRANDESESGLLASCAGFLGGYAILCDPLQRAAEMAIGFLKDKDRGISVANICQMFVVIKKNLG